MAVNIIEFDYKLMIVVKKNKTEKSHKEKFIEKSSMQDFMLVGQWTS